MSRWFRVEKASANICGGEFEVDDYASQDEIEQMARECVEVDYVVTEINGRNGDPIAAAG